MNNISSIQNLYVYDDGDTITPRMGVSIAAGFGLSQFWDPSTKTIVNTDFSLHPAILYPQAYSSKSGKIIVPETTGQQWYYNNPEGDGMIGSDGTLKAAYTDRFELTTISVNGATFPALKIKGNLATDADHTDKYIYYRSTYSGKSFTCQQLISIQETIGSNYEILLSFRGQDGSGDDVLSNDNDYVDVTAALQLKGTSVASGVDYVWQKLINNVWTDIETTDGLYEVVTEIITIKEAAVEGVEMFRCAATYAGKTYYKVFQITDIHDPYYIVPNSSNPGNMIPRSESVTFRPRVYDRSNGTDVTYTIHGNWIFNYQVSDSNGNILSTGSGRNFTVDGEMIYNADTHAVLRIEAIYSVAETEEG